MNRYLFFGVIFCSILVVGFLCGFYLFSMRFSDASDNNHDVLPPQGINPRATDVVIGNSMLPTYQDGDTLIWDQSNIYPQVGDVISFECLVPKCLNGDQYGDAGRVKRVTKLRDDGSMWVEGDNATVSHDSRSYGWLSPTDIQINGVVVNEL